MPASMPTSNSLYPSAPLAQLIDVTNNDHQSINNNNNNNNHCNGAVSESTTQIDTNKIAYRNHPTENNKTTLGITAKSHRTKNKMNFQVVCCTVTLVICCIVITGFEVWNSMETWKLKTEINVLHGKLATLQAGFDQLKNTTTNFISRPPLQSDARWKDSNRNVSDEEYDDDYAYDEDAEYDDNESEDNGRNGSIGGQMKQSFDGDTAEYTDVEERKLLSAIPLSEHEFDATDTVPTERNETVKRTSRSVSSGDNGIPVIDGTYAENRKDIEESRETISVNVSHRLNDINNNNNNRSNVPRFHHDWLDRSGSTINRKYPKKYDSQTDDSNASTNHRHRHRHRQGQDGRKLSSTQPHTFQTSIDDASPPMPTTIDFSNLFASPHFEQDMQGSNSQLNEEIIRHTNAYRPKPRRRILRPPPPQSTPIVRAARSPLHQSGMRFKTIAVHYQGDTSPYMMGGRVSPHHQERFDGNGRVRHPGGIYSDWKPAYWVDDHAMERFFAIHQGIVTVKEHGLYYIYAQIFYHDDHDTNGYIVEHNSEPLYQCTTATHSNERVTKSNTCHTAGINYLNAGDRIHIKDLGSHRYTLFDASKSFFGLIKVGDLRGGGGISASSSMQNT